MSNLFAVKHLSGDLKNRAIRGGMVTVGSQFAKFLLQTGSTVVMARLLTPADFGLIGMVTPITGFVGLFKDMGLSMATVQRDEITQEQVSSLFWINVGISFLLALLAAIFAPLSGWFYNDTRVVPITVALGCLFILGGLTAQHQALINRQMKFHILAGIELTALLVGILSGIAAARWGLTYWSLVIMQAVMGLTNLLLVWRYSPWRPSRLARLTHIRELVSFGAHLTVSNILNYFCRNLDHLLIGKKNGDVALGLYSKAYQLLMLPITQINVPVSQVAFPMFSRMQNDPDQYRRYYRKSMTLMTLLSVPLVLFCYVAADWLIPVVLGKQWLESIPIFKALAPAALMGVLNVSTSWVYISLGKVKQQLIIGAIFTVVTVCAFLLGVKWGPIGVAWSFSISRVLVKPLDVLYCFRHSPLNLRDLLQPLMWPFTFAVAATVVAGILGNLLSARAYSAGVILGGMAMIMGGVYGLLVVCNRETRSLIGALLKKNHSA